MPVIQYGRELSSELDKKKSINIKANSQYHWQLFKVDIENKKYYLYIEVQTGIVVVNSKIDFMQFAQVAEELFKTFSYISPKQQKRFLDDVLKDQSLTFSRNDLITNNWIKPIKEYLTTNLNDFKKKTDLDNLVPVSIQLMAKSLALMSVSVQSAGKIVRNIATLANDKFPMKTKRPAGKNLKYWDLSKEFTDPKKWKNYLYKLSSEKENVISEIQDNNRLIVKQYLKNAKIDLKNNAWPVQDQLLDFLNEYLLIEDIRFATTNLGDLNFYLWSALMETNADEDGAIDLIEIFNDFYNFLSRVGLINLSGVQTEQWMTGRLLDNYIEPEEELEEPELNETEQGIVKMVLENPDHFRTLARMGGLPPQLAEIINNILDNKDAFLKFKTEHIDFENEERNTANYEIRVKLADFKPSIWRRFVISGNSTIETLMRAIIIMFNGEFEHMYSLRLRNNLLFEMNRFKDQAFSFEDSIDSEKAKVSMLNQGEIADLNYDYGDDWHFILKVKNISFDQANIKKPAVISGKRYGIIEDIGGSIGLQEYYDDFKDNKLDPEFIDWMGGESIDLDVFDKNKINSFLEKM